MTLASQDPAGLDLSVKLGPSAYATLAAVMSLRRSIRVFAAQPVSESIKRELLAAFDSAPVASGDKARRRLIFPEPELIKRLAETGLRAYEKWLATVESPAIAEALRSYGSNFFWFGAAPLLAVAVVKKAPAFLACFGPKADLVFGAHFSAAMGLEAALLAATSLGLGGCCLGGVIVVAKELGDLLGLSAKEEISLMAAFGYPLKEL